MNQKHKIIKKKKTVFTKAMLRKLDWLHRKNEKIFKNDKTTLKLLRWSVAAQKRIIKRRLLLK